MKISIFFWLFDSFLIIISVIWAILVVSPGIIIHHIADFLVYIESLLVH